MQLPNFHDRAIERLGIKQLNSMQEAMYAQTLPANIRLLAPTGSGKTLAFILPFLKALRSDTDKVVGLIIAPTRELVLQIAEVVRVIAAPEWKTVALYGGHNFTTEANSLTGKPNIIVATPGRLLDHIHRGRVSLFDISALVLDEYDKALELGFAEEMKAIVGRAKNVSTLILTSATAAIDIPEWIPAKKIKSIDFTEDVVSPEIEVIKVHSESKDKLHTLEMLLRTIQGQKTIVFANHREAVDRISSFLRSKKFPVGIYHGALEQQERERGLILFSNGTTPILIATDLAARGLDIDNVVNVINYHLPLSAEGFTHRIGRTARQGAQGKAFVILSEQENIPDYITFDKEITPEVTDDEIVPTKWSTLFINAGKKEKISRGDIVGYLISRGGLTSSEIGKIDVKDHCAYVAVPYGRSREIIAATAPFKLKNQRVRITQLKQI